MFQRLSFRAKLIGLVALNLAFLGVVGGVALVQLERIGVEFQGVAQADVPLANDFARAANAQVDQALELETALRFTGLSGAGKGDDRLRRASEGFRDAASEVETVLAEARGIAEKALQSARDEASRREYSQLLEKVSALGDTHQRYDRMGEQVLELAVGADIEQAAALEAQVEQLQDQLDRDTSALAKQIEGFTAEAANTASTHEAAAVRTIAVLAAIALVLGMLLGLALAQSVSTGLSSCSRELQAVGGQMLSSVQQQSASTNETASSVSETTSTVDELQQTAELASQKAQGVAEAAEKSRSSSEAARDSVERGGEMMRRIREEVEGIAKNILELSERNLQIGEIVQSVSAIAEQSNLLAVNASIEAAKAGEAGKGFAVVATEVKALASQSREATDQIRGLLAEIQKSSNAAVMVTEQGTKRVGEGAGAIDELGAALDQLARVVEENADSGRQISMTANQQLAGVQQIATAMRNIEQATKDNAAGAHQLEQAARQVSAVAGRLEVIVGGASV